MVRQPKAFNGEILSLVNADASLRLRLDVIDDCIENFT